MQSHHIDHNDLMEDINTANGIAVNLKSCWILWEKEKERAERQIHALCLPSESLLSTALRTVNKSDLPCLHGIPSSQHPSKNNSGERGSPGLGLAHLGL